MPNRKLQVLENGHSDTNSHSAKQHYGLTLTRSYLRSSNPAAHQSAGLHTQRRPRYRNRRVMNSIVHEETGNIQLILMEKRKENYKHSV